MKIQKEIPIVAHLESFSSGVTDALTVSLALAAGLWFAGFENGNTALACLVVSISIAFVMGAGSYFSRHDQLHDTPENSLKEWNRTKTLLINLGLTSEQISMAEQEWLKEQSQPKNTEQDIVPIST
ncbi:MAG: hypothetical protein EOO01_07800 [Chitinophagaceae bacterium]|nr:MAG: hypothetical protein EOO01_07800 [Chitinophagaceae bacterium]